MNLIIILPILIAFILGACTFKLKGKEEKQISRYAVLCVSFTSVISIVSIALAYEESLTIFRFNDILNLSFKIDGLSCVFVGIIAFLWPFATVYATKYMSHLGKTVKFFAFYTMTFGSVLGIAFSGNLFTMYIFYELLTFITLPLVMHEGKNRDIYAAKKYIAYSMLGAAFVFAGLMVFAYYQGSLDFVSGGMITDPLSTEMIISYILMFVGFSVKAGIFPFHGWLIGAGVAPVTTTALLHAVAVVKSGVFAVMRVTYYLFGAEVLSGTMAQNFVLALSAFTIIFGSAMALRSNHLKRRFAYSTVSQLSYILLAIGAMSGYGLVAACLHMIFHALMKIVIFYTAGNVAFMSGKEYVEEIEGFGKVMKVTFITYTISSLSLMGIPPFGGFFSKFAIGTAMVQTANSFAYFGIIALILSALMTSVYTLQITGLAFWPNSKFNKEKLSNLKPANKSLTYPMVIITTVMVVLSLFSNQLVTLLETILLGGM